jgi:uncharacterized protein (UPF0335 family)
MDAVTYFTPNECEVLRKYIEINDQMSSIKSENERLNKEVKAIMAKHNTAAAEIDGTKFNITSSVRKTIKRGKKDEFIAEILKMNKKYLCTQEIDIDMDSLKSEVDAGMFDANTYNKFVTESDVVTLKLT